MPLKRLPVSLSANRKRVFCQSRCRVYPELKYQPQYFSYSAYFHPLSFIQLEIWDLVKSVSPADASGYKFVTTCVIFINDFRIGVYYMLVGEKANVPYPKGGSRTRRYTENALLNIEGWNTQCVRSSWIFYSSLYGMENKVKVYFGGYTFMRDQFESKFHFFSFNFETVFLLIGYKYTAEKLTVLYLRDILSLC